ncbi:B12-binding domain-containing radical SAM protein [Rhizobium grahamii]|uniref:Methyltransferase/methylase n=1 Tax=Rhizobium grahamii CCGE 502 TaxID=990285 RepID=S3HLW1_9HYPH|nr:radical SAM protein [Rhizobium grahamii]EPE94381.1 methyltransferase/methylase [Rhizobium grahamii CCGE 502]
MIILVNPPTLWELQELGMEGKLSCFELQSQHVSPSALKSFPGEHLGLQALASACRQKGLQVSLVNGQILLHKSLDEIWRAILDRAGKEPPAVVGFSGPNQVFVENVALARRVKERWPDTVTVLGADFATLNADRILNDYEVFDAIVAGEGEVAFPALCAAAADGDPFDQLPGVLTRETVRVTLQAPPPLNLDDIPWIARDDTRAVLALGLSAGVYSSRGCPYRCSFCTTGQVSARSGQGGHREKSIENVVDEIDYLATDFGIDHVTITDDLFVTKHPASQERARRFGALYKSRGLSSIPFMIDCRVDSMDRETLSVLRSAGLHRVFVGIETASADTLDAYDKLYVNRALPQYINDRLRIASDLGIDVVPGIITYHPEITVPELRRTLNVVDSVGYRGSFQFLNKVVAHPGTPIWKAYAAKGYLNPEWPVPQWGFRNPDAQSVADAAFAAAAAGGDFEQIRGALLSAIEQWEARQPEQ